MNMPSTEVKNKSEILLINLMTLFFIFRSSIPEFKYPFIVLYVYFIISFLFLKRNIFGNIKSYVKAFSLILILGFVFFGSAFTTYKLYLEVFKDSLNIVVLLSVLFFLIVSITTTKELSFYVSNLIDCIALFSVIISVYGIFDFFRIYFIDGAPGKYSNALEIDYNFALLPVFFGILTIIYRLLRVNSIRNIRLYNLLLFVLTFQVFLSSSRRGFMLLTILLFTLYISFLISVLFRRSSLNPLLKNFHNFLIIIPVSFLCLFIFLYLPSTSLKHRMLKSIGMKNTIIFQEDITERAYRYLEMFKVKTSYSRFHNSIWKSDFDSKNPNSGWGNRIHKTIFPLTGKNVEIVPSDAKGYLMDKTCNAYVEDGNSYSYTNLYQYNLDISENDSVQVSVYCYISEDFDGDWALIALTNNTTTWIGSSSYEMMAKGSWQKLTVNAKCREGEISSYLYFCKKGSPDFSTLKGHIIFAYPECKILNGRKIPVTRISDTKKEKSLTLAESGLSKKTVSEECGLSLDYLMLNKGHLAFCYIGYKDPIRQWASKLVSEDTTYRGLKTNIVVRQAKDNFIDMRFVRWQFAWQIFTKEYNLKQKLTGGGFSFLNWYGYTFLKDKTKTDYPHNPFLYILLYSGIIGSLLYLYFIFKVFFLYLKYIKQYFLLVTFFLISFYFTFFSGGNPFDPPIMGFFSILPFFIHSVHKRADKVSKISK